MAREPIKKPTKAPAKRPPRNAEAASGPVLTPDETEKVSHILGSVWAAGDDELVTAFTALASALADVRPANIMQAKLLAQMTASHQASMECFRRAATAGDDAARRDSELRHAARFAQIYILQYSALEKAKGAERARADNSKMNPDEAREFITKMAHKYLGRPKEGE